MTPRYSSKQQETHFQPCRVRVLIEPVFAGYYSHGWPRYHIVIQDMVTHKLTGGQSTQPTKAEAISAAKELAQRKNLPFNLSTDVLDYDEAVAGPKLTCDGCGRQEYHEYDRSWTRGWGDTFLCATCKTRVQSVLKGETPRRIYGINRYVFPSGIGLKRGRHDAEWRFVELLMVLAQSPLDSKHWDRHYLKRLAEREGQNSVSDLEWSGAPKGYRGDTIAMARLTPEQANAYLVILDLLAEQFELAYGYGKNIGSSLIRKLASGELHPDDFSEARHPHKKENR